MMLITNSLLPITSMQVKSNIDLTELWTG
jgi:hypothetical protein